MTIKITSIEYYLPSKVVDNSVLIEKMGFEESFLKEKLGIQVRRHAGPDETSFSLAVGAIKKLIKKTEVNLNSIDFLLIVTQTPDYQLPNISPMIQEAVGLPTGICSLDINLGCSGFVYALATAKGLMATNGFKRGIIITSETYSKLLLKNDRITSPLFGDAAAAVMIEASRYDKVGFFDFGTDGSGAEALILRTGGGRYPRSRNDETDSHLFMNGRAIYTFMMTRIPQSVKNCLSANHLTPDDIDYYVFHQASKFLLGSLKERMQIPEYKMVYQLADCGNTVSSSIPIALKNLLEENLNQNKPILISGFGAGFSWATTVIRT